MKLKPPFAIVCAQMLALCALGAEPEQSLNFMNDVEPILTKAGCNAGACHAKAGVGQRGFRLSLLGFEPQEDYEHIVKEGKGRRVFPVAPEQSLLLLKATNNVPHGGGKKLDPKSDEYKTLVRWISEGMSFGKDTDAKLVSIDVEPKRGPMKLKLQQQLKVMAHYSDGTTRDVTHAALYEPNDKCGEDVVERACWPGDFLATIYHHLGIDASKITINDLNGRPTALVSDGRPIAELMGRAECWLACDARCQHDKVVSLT